jgi:hypothetical protein
MEVGITGGAIGMRYRRGFNFDVRTRLFFRIFNLAGLISASRIYPEWIVYMNRVIKPGCRIWAPHTNKPVAPDGLWLIPRLNGFHQN